MMQQYRRRPPALAVEPVLRRVAGVETPTQRLAPTQRPILPIEEDDTQTRLLGQLDPELLKRARRTIVDDDPEDHVITTAGQPASASRSGINTVVRPSWPTLSPPVLIPPPPPSSRRRRSEDSIPCELEPWSSSIRTPVPRLARSEARVSPPARRVTRPEARVSPQAARVDTQPRTIVPTSFIADVDWPSPTGPSPLPLPATFGERAHGTATFSPPPSSFEHVARDAAPHSYRTTERIPTSSEREPSRSRSTVLLLLVTVLFASIALGLLVSTVGRGYRACLSTER
jgi:hypothetical protein